MIVYLFYTHGNNLAPQLYGYTDNKLRAQVFAGFRDLCLIKKEVKKSEFQLMKDKTRELEIIPHKFRTSSEAFGSEYVLHTATVREVNSILLHSDEILLRELNKHTIAMDLFDKNFKSSLVKLGYGEASAYLEEVQVYDFDRVKAYDFSYKIDELGLFLSLYQNTFKTSSEKEK